MRLPGFLRDLIGAMTVHACDTAQAELRANLVDGRETLREVAQSIVGPLFDAAREDVRRNFERMTLFGLLFRSLVHHSRGRHCERRGASPPSATTAQLAGRLTAPVRTAA